MYRWAEMQKMDIPNPQWIFHNTLFKDDQFADEIRDITKNFVENKYDNSKMILWEFLKQNMASSSRNYASKKAREELKKLMM